MRRQLILDILLLVGILRTGYAGDSASGVTNIEGILNDNHQQQLEVKAWCIEGQSNVAIKIITTFHFGIDWDVQLYHTAGGTATSDSRLVITNRLLFGSSSFDEQFANRLSLSRSENLNTDELLPRCEVCFLSRNMTFVKIIQV